MPAKTGGEWEPGVSLRSSGCTNGFAVRQKWHVCEPGPNFLLAKNGNADSPAVFPKITRRPSVCAPTCFCQVDRAAALSALFPVLARRHQKRTPGLFFHNRIDAPPCWLAFLLKIKKKFSFFKDLTRRTRRQHDPPIKKQVGAHPECRLVKFRKQGGGAEHTVRPRECVASQSQSSRVVLHAPCHEESWT